LLGNWMLFIMSSKATQFTFPFNSCSLNYCILRPAIVYGPGDILGISNLMIFFLSSVPIPILILIFLCDCFKLDTIAPRIIIGAVYKQLGEEMSFLWSKDLKINTVHVRDVCRALLIAAEKAKKGDIFNLADSGETSENQPPLLFSLFFGS